MNEPKTIYAPCPHCQQSQNNKVLFINGSVGNKKKLIVVYKTATDDLKVEFNTEAEIKYCPVCGRKLSKADDSHTDDPDEDKECSYCIDDDVFRLCMEGKSLLDSEIPRNQMLYINGPLYEGDRDYNALKFCFQTLISPCCLSEIRTYLHIQYCPMCGKELPKRATRIFEAEHNE